MSDELISVPAPRREQTDVTGVFIVTAFVGMIVLLGAAGLISWWIFPRSVHPGFLDYPVASYPAPELEPSPHEDFVRFYRTELNRLNSIGWVDRTKGIAHIPIEQAMQEVASKGIRDWPGSTPTAPPAAAPAKSAAPAGSKAPAANGGGK